MCEGGPMIHLRTGTYSGYTRHKLKFSRLTSRNYLASNKLALALQKRFDDAIDQLHQAIQIKPGDIHLAEIPKL